MVSSGTIVIVGGILGFVAFVTCGVVFMRFRQNLKKLQEEKNLKDIEAAKMKKKKARAKRNRPPLGKKPGAGTTQPEAVSQAQRAGAKREKEQKRNRVVPAASVDRSEVKTTVSTESTPAKASRSPSSSPQSRVKAPAKVDSQSSEQSAAAVFAKPKKPTLAMLSPKHVAKYLQLAYRPYVPGPQSEESVLVEPTLVSDATPSHTVVQPGVTLELKRIRADMERQQMYSAQEYAMYGAPLLGARSDAASDKEGDDDIQQGTYGYEDEEDYDELRRQKEDIKAKSDKRYAEYLKRVRAEEAELDRKRAAEVKRKREQEAAASLRAREERARERNRVRQEKLVAANKKSEDAKRMLREVERKAKQDAEERAERLQAIENRLRQEDEAREHRLQEEEEARVRAVHRAARGETLPHLQKLKREQAALAEEEAALLEAEELLKKEETELARQTDFISTYVACHRDRTRSIEERGGAAVNVKVDIQDDDKKSKQEAVLRAQELVIRLANVIEARQHALRIEYAARLSDVRHGRDVALKHWTTRRLNARKHLASIPIIGGDVDGSAPPSSSLSNNKVPMSAETVLPEECKIAERLNGRYCFAHVAVNNLVLPSSSSSSSSSEKGKEVGANVNPVVACYGRDPDSNNWVLLDQTEQQTETSSPMFTSALLLTLGPDVDVEEADDVNQFRFIVYHVPVQSNPFSNPQALASLTCTQSDLNIDSDRHTAMVMKRIGIASNKEAEFKPDDDKDDDVLMSPTTIIIGTQPICGELGVTLLTRLIDVPAGDVDGDGDGGNPSGGERNTQVNNDEEGKDVVSSQSNNVNHQDNTQDGAVDEEEKRGADLTKNEGEGEGEGKGKEEEEEEEEGQTEDKQNDRKAKGEELDPELSTINSASKTVKFKPISPARSVGEAKQDEGTSSPARSYLSSARSSRSGSVSSYSSSAVSSLAQSPAPKLSPEEEEEARRKYEWDMHPQEHDDIPLGPNEDGGFPLLVRISCGNLPQSRRLNPPDTLVALYEMNSKTEKWVFVGQTERYARQHNPHYLTALPVVHYHDGRQQFLRFDVYDASDSDGELHHHDHLLGRVAVAFNDVGPHNKGSVTYGLLGLSHEQLTYAGDVITITLDCYERGSEGRNL